MLIILYDNVNVNNYIIRYTTIKLYLNNSLIFLITIFFNSSKVKWSFEISHLQDCDMIARNLLCQSSENGILTLRRYIDFSSNCAYIARKIYLVRGQTSFQVYVQGYGRNSGVLTSRTSIRGRSLTHLILGDRERIIVGFVSETVANPPTRKSKALA